MSKLNLEDDNVCVTTVSVDAAREIETGNKEFDEALDQAQALVFGGAYHRAYLVIEIVPEKT